MKVLISSMVLLIVVVGTAAAFPLDPEKGAEENYEIRSYDVSDLLRPGFVLQPYYHLFPLELQEYHLSQNAQTELMDTGYIVDMISYFLGEELFEFNGISMEAFGSQIVVKAPPPMHDQIARLLAFMDSHINRQVTLQLDLFSVGPPNMKDARNTLRSASQKGQLKPLLSRRFSMQLGELWEIEDGTTHPIIVDYEPEIAQGSAVGEPILTELFVGMKLALRPYLALDEKTLYVGLTGTASSFAQPMSQREGLFDGRITTDDKVMNLGVANEIDEPQISFGSIASMLTVAPDTPAMAGMACWHMTGLGGFAIRVSGHVSPAEREIEFDDGRIVSAYDLGSLRAQSFEPFFSSGKKNTDPYDWDQYELYHYEYRQFNHSIYSDLSLRELEIQSDRHGYGYYNITMEMRDDREVSGMMMQNPVFDSGEQDPERCLIGHQLFLLHQENSGGAVGAQLVDTMMPDSTPVPVEIAFVEIPGVATETDPERVMQSGTLQGCVSLSMKRGSAQVAMAGCQGIKLDGYDVDVATRAAIANPNFSAYLDGALVHLEHEVKESIYGNTDSMKARICLNRLVEFGSTGDLGGGEGFIGVIDKPCFKKATMSSEFPCDGKMHILGSMTGQQGEGQRTTYVLGWTDRGDATAEK